MARRVRGQPLRGATMKGNSRFRRLATGVLLVLSLSASDALAVQVGTGPNNGVCSVFGASPTAQVGLGKVEGQGFLLCSINDLSPYSVTLTVCAQRAFFFRPTQILYQ